MHPKINQKLFLFIQATIFSIYFPTFLCKNNTIIYPALVPKCSDEPFNCGSIRWYISYPFWGGSRNEECGREGFELVCRAGVPMLNISSLSYRVQQIDFNTYTLNVAREDLQNNICPKVLHNTTIDLKPFKYPLSSNDKKVTLYFNCTSDQYQLETLPNKFTCDVNNVKRAETINLFKTGDASSGPGSNITCNNNIFVPIKQEAAQSLENLSASSINILQSALASGFSIQWSPDVVQYFGAVCNSHVYDHCLSEVQGSNAAKNLSEVIVIVVALTTIIVVVVSIIIHIFLKRRHSASGPNQRPNQNVQNFLLRHGSLTPTRYRYSEIKKITKSFSDKLGQGGYGTVYKGMLPDGSPVAVKVLIETNSNGEEFINEVASISRTSHVNIISLLGFCYEGNRRALIYEFMPNKSLDKFLNNNGSAANTDCGLDLEKLYEIAVGIAKGLEYLHTGCSTRIVHFDIKPQNILLDEDFCPKISDFGLAKLCKRKQSILSELGTRGTIGYIAPELFSRTFGGVSHKSDVYSYGMMVLEMAGARKIVENEVAQSSENYFPDKIYEQIILNVAWKSNNSMTEDEEAIARKMFLVGFWCIQITPSERPSMSRVVEMLEGSIQSIEIPPKPFLFSPLPGKKNSFSFSTYTETENSAQDNGVLLLRSDTTNQCVR